MVLDGLATSAREHIELLRAVHRCEGDLYNQGEELNQAIIVYASSWLPALNNYDDAVGLELPALDVAWVWHLHKTDPTSYHRDCIRWYGRILDVPSGASPFRHSSRLSSPPNLHCNVNCPHLDFDFAERIVSSAKNQSSFLWHVNWPEYEDDSFLEDSVQRYGMMLALMNQHPGQFIVPTYDIDIIWHTHLAFPCRYIEDCRRLAGRDVNHDDQVGEDRSPGGFLTTSTAKTELLWNSTFSSPWRKEGGMYRGEPPSWYWSDRHRASALPRVPQQAPKPDLPAESTLGLFLARHVIGVVGRAFGTDGITEVRIAAGAFPQFPPGPTLCVARRE